MSIEEVKMNGRYGSVIHAHYNPKLAYKRFRGYLVDVAFFFFIGIFIGSLVVFSILTPFETIDKSSNEYLIGIIGAIIICFVCFFWGNGAYRKFNKFKKLQMIVFEKAIVLSNIETGEEIRKYIISEIKIAYDSSEKFSKYIGLIMEKDGIRRYERINKIFVYDEEGFRRDLKSIVPKYERKQLSWKERKQIVNEFNVR